MVLKKKHLCLATLFRTLSAPPELDDYLCVNSTKRRYSENQYRVITTANWGQPTMQLWAFFHFKWVYIGLAIS